MGRGGFSHSRIRERSIRSAKSEERLEAEMAGLLDSIESGVLLLDADGRIRMASDRLAAIFGLDSRRLLEFGTIDALIDSLAHPFRRPRGNRGAMARACAAGR